MTHPGSAGSAIIGGGVAIPDSVVSRPVDDYQVSGEFVFAGVGIETKTEWPSIGARISNNTTGASEARIEDNNGNLLQSVDVSTLGAGDTFTFEDVNLSANTTYRLKLYNANEFLPGFVGENNWPYTSPDVDLIGGILEGFADAPSTARVPFAVNDVGNTGFD